MRTDGTPQISIPVVVPGSPCGEKSTLDLSDFLTCGSQRDCRLCESGGISKWRTGQLRVLPGVQAPCEEGLRRFNPNREGSWPLQEGLGGPRVE